MDKAQLILYGVATYLALRSLVSLMSEHRQHYKKKVAEELNSAVPVTPLAPIDKKPAGSRTAAQAPKPAASNTAPNVAAKTAVNAAAKNVVKSPVNEAAKAPATAAKAG